jgi:hypothetical protein
MQKCSEITEAETATQLVQQAKLRKPSVNFVVDPTDSFLEHLRVREKSLRILTPGQ